MSREKLPTTDYALVFGHPLFSPRSIRRAASACRTLESLSPAFKRQSEAGIARMREDMGHVADEKSGWIVSDLKRRKILKVGQSVRLSRAYPDPALSSVDAYVSLTGENEESMDAQWALHVYNNGTKGLFSVETADDNESAAYMSQRNRITRLEAIDPETGQAFTPEEYDSRGESELYQTVGRAFDSLSDAVIIHGYGDRDRGFSITELPGIPPRSDN